MDVVCTFNTNVKIGGNRMPYILQILGTISTAYWIRNCVSYVESRVYRNRQFPARAPACYLHVHSRIDTSISVFHWVIVFPDSLRFISFRLDAFICILRCTLASSWRRNQMQPSNVRRRPERRQPDRRLLPAKSFDGPFCSLLPLFYARIEALDACAFNLLGVPVGMRCSGVDQRFGEIVSLFTLISVDFFSRSFSASTAQRSFRFNGIVHSPVDVQIVCSPLLYEYRRSAHPTVNENLPHKTNWDTLPKLQNG